MQRAVQRIQKQPVEAFPQNVGNDLLVTSRMPPGIPNVDVLISLPNLPGPDEQAFRLEFRKVTVVLTGFAQADVPDEPFPGFCQGGGGGVVSAIQDNDLVRRKL